MTAAMAIYGIVIMLTVPTFQGNTTLTLMSIFGLVNVLVILPTNIYEDWMMLQARSNSVGLKKAQPLTFGENALVVGFLVIANLIIGGVILFSIVIIVGPDLWGVLIGLYIGMNVVPIVLPKVEHLVSTETRTWPLKVLLLHFALVVTSVVLTAIAIVSQRPSKNIRRAFGTIGVINGAS